MPHMLSTCLLAVLTHAPCPQVVSRITYILDAPHLGAAVSPSLALLGRFARAGLDAARAVWNCPGLPTLLMCHLKAAKPAAGGDPSAAASYERRWQVMRCLRDICSWHPRAGQHLIDAGEVSPSNMKSRVHSASQASCSNNPHRTNLAGCESHGSQVHSIGALWISAD